MIVFKSIMASDKALVIIENYCNLFINYFLLKKLPTKSIQSLEIFLLLKKHKKYWWLILEDL